MSLVDEGLRHSLARTTFNLGLHSHYGAIQIRSFFDSPDGNKLFRHSYPVWIGWLLNTMKYLETTMESSFPDCWLVLSDDPKVAQNILSLNAMFPDKKFIALSSQPVHTSVAFRMDRTHLQNRPSNILDQYWMNSIHLQQMYGDLAEWYLLANAALMLTTGTSYAGTADAAIKESCGIHYSLCGENLLSSALYGPY
jgi:hypothetical protein